MKIKTIIILTLALTICSFNTSIAKTKTENLSEIVDSMFDLKLQDDFNKNKYEGDEKKYNLPGGGKAYKYNPNRSSIDLDAYLVTIEDDSNKIKSIKGYSAFKSQRDAVKKRKSIETEIAEYYKEPIVDPDGNYHYYKNDESILIIYIKKSQKNKYTMNIDCLKTQ